MSSLFRQARSFSSSVCEMQLHPRALQRGYWKGCVTIKWAASVCQKLSLPTLQEPDIRSPSEDTWLSS